MIGAVKTELQEVVIFFIPDIIPPLRKREKNSL